MISKKLFFFSSALFLALPIGILSGCGGGGSGGSGSSTNSQTYNSALSLSPGQIAQFGLDVREDFVSGKLIVPAKSTQSRTTQEFSFNVPAGSYAALGSLSALNRFSVSGRIPTVGTFIVTGQLPINGGTGAYTITANGQSATGLFENPRATTQPMPNEPILNTR